MTQAIRTSVSVLALCALLGVAAPADAQISGGGAAVLPWTSRWDVAYDSVNQVYLLLFDGHPSSKTLRPVMGQFADANLNPIGGMFDITSEFAISGEAPSWATVTFGGTASDPTFLVTYIVPGEGGTGIIPKYGRLVRYRAGAAPSVSARALVFSNVGGEWFAAERARPAWNGSRFIVPTRVPGGAVGAAFAQPVFSFFDLDGTSSGGVNMGTTLDYQGGPSVACGPGNVCMAAGFAAGVPFGAVGGIWARLFNGATLQPLTEVFYPDDHSTFMDTPHVVYNANTGQFNMVWYRRVTGTGALDFRVVNTDGSLGPLDLTRSFTIFPGEPGLSYNPISKSSLLVTKWGSEASLYALELGNDGYPRDLSNAVLITAWDGRVLEYRPAVTARTDAPHWLVTFNLGASSGVVLVTGAGGGGPPPPPPPAGLTVSISANVAPPLAAGMGITWTASSTGGTGVEYKFYRMTSGESWMVGQDWNPANTFTWFPPAGTHAVQVWARSSGSTAPFDAYAGTGFFTVSPGNARLTSFFADKPMPAPSNTAITWTATADSGAGAVEYLFWRYSASTGWVLGQGYSSSNKYTWFPPDGVNSLQVWVRRVGSTADYEDYAATSFAVQPNPARFAAVTTGTVFPAAPGTPITWTAVPGGGSGAYEYKFLLLSAATNQWQILRGWSTNPQATWTPQGTGLFTLQVWIRNVGSYLDYEDWRGTEWFSVTNSTALTLTATNRLLIDLRAGDFVRFQADVAGPGQWEYQFWGYANPGMWTLRQVYTSQNWYDLVLPAGVNAVQVWIRPTGSNVPWERYQTTGYFVVQ